MNYSRWKVLCTRCKTSWVTRSYASQADVISRPSHSEWKPVIGLEVHAQINSKTKIFSSALNKFMAPPNSLVSQFDASMPGTLPVLNKECVRAAVMTAFALNCNFNLRSTFDRKHYFYADMPHGYQITQHWTPIAFDGHFTFPSSNGMESKSLKIERLQLEQDSGKSLHDEIDNVSLIDLNRAGVGLMEIVTAPELHSATDACAFIHELHLMLCTLGTCEGKMSEGQFRVDVNVSLHKPGEAFGTRAEVKNIAGIKHLQQVVDYEIERQADLLTRGLPVDQETRAFDVANGTTYSMRDKEVKTDYRFMPEPNLPPLQLYTDDTVHTARSSDINIDDIRRKLPLLPSEIRKVLLETHRLTFQQTVFLLERQMDGYFLAISNHAPSLRPVEIYHWLKIKVVSLLADTGITMAQWPISGKDFAELMLLKESNEINDSIAFDALSFSLSEKKKSPIQIIDEKNWKMISDVKLVVSLCNDVITSMETENPAVFKKYDPGNRKSSKKIVAKVVGKVYELSGGKMHTAVIKQTVQSLLNSRIRK